MAPISDYISVLIDNIPGLQETGMNLSTKLHDFVRARPTLRKAVDVLHGKQVGHPIHPILQTITVGAWALGSAVDLVAALKPSPHLQQTADDLIEIGTVSAIPTALSGLADYSGLPQEAIKVGTLHLAANVVGLSLYSLSILSRKSGQRGIGVALSLAGVSVIGLSGYLGGDMAYRLRVGVNHNAPPNEDDEPHWRQVLTNDELAVDETKQVMLEEQPILLYRDSNGVYAIGNVCSHAGGPLNEGKFEGACVECPWHHSVFDLRNGNVIHGPAVYSQPVFPVRIRAGHIEVLTKPDAAHQARKQIDGVQEAQTS